MGLERLIMNGFHGKYFSITDPEGVNTVIYRINETAKQLQNKYPKNNAFFSFQNPKMSFYVE